MEGRRDTAASSEAVWGLLADVDLWPRTLTPHLKAAHLNGPLEGGATGWVQTKLPLPRSSFTVTSVEEGRGWAWRGKFLWLTMDFDHSCEPIETGCRVILDVNLDGPLARVVRPMARLINRPQMERALTC